jgi:hypothetical protein
MTLEGLHCSEISSTIRRSALERNFDVTIGGGGGLHAKHAVQLGI